MQRISKTQKRVLAFWKKKTREKDLIISGTDFPDEYVRKFLQKEGLIFAIKKGLYVIKKKGEDEAGLTCRLYWEIVEKILRPYKPWSIEKESALTLHLGEESIPRRLLIRTARKVKYSFTLPGGLRFVICPARDFHLQTCQSLKIGNAVIFLDIPEKVLFSLRERKGIKFTAFLKSAHFNKRTLEILYSSNPKPVVTKELIKLAKKNNLSDLSLCLKDILKRYTIYRP